GDRHQGPELRQKLRQGGCICITTTRWKVLCLRCGTSLERIAAESATLALFDFVHRDIWHEPAQTIPDRVAHAVPGIVNWSKILTSAREQKFQRSQGQVRCG